MGYPVLTRLGINQFWYRHWYSDINYTANIQQDYSFETIINIYLMYGLSYINNIFIHEYWYNLNYKSRRTKLKDIQLRLFFRRVFYKYSKLDIEHNYRLRLETNEFFPMRTWILKYNNWVIISVQWFKPDKKNKLKKIFRKATKYPYKPQFNFAQNNRLKLLILYNLYNFFSKKNYIF